MDTADLDETITHNGTGPTIGGVADAETGGGEVLSTDPGEVRPDATTSGAPDVTSGFMSELTEAMMGVVGKERDRIGAIVEADAAAHLVEAKEHAAAESEAFRQVADEDVASIEGWAEAEVERIRADAATRIADRRADLDTSLAQHDAVLAGELQGIETAVADYGVTLQSFLDDLRTTGDPAEIADRSRSLPTPPNLNDVRAIARAAALTRIAEEAAAVEAPAAEAVVIDDADASAGAVSEASPLDALAVDETTTPADPVEAPSDARSVSGAEIAEIPAVVEEVSSARSAWETDGGLETLMDTPAQTLTAAHVSASAAPVGVMDPAATASTGWDTDIEVPVAVATAVATAEPGDVGHPNAAVRLIRSVAPWTAPTHSTGRTDDDAR